MLSSPPAKMRVGVFGASAAGKTSLLASFFGSQQRFDTEQRLGYRMTAVDVNDGNRLLRDYYQMQEGHFPQSTALTRARTYEFDLKLAGQVRPAVRIEWIDYKGGWWESDQPLDLSEREGRQTCILELLDADGCILLLDGEKYKDEATRADYLREEFSRYGREIQLWLKVAAKNNRRPQTVIKDWIIVLSKADLLGSGYRAEDFHKAVLVHAFEQQARLTELLGNKPSEAEEANRRFGTHYMLLSAAQANQRQVVSVDNNVGLDFIVPALLKTFLLKLAGQQKQTPELPPLSPGERLLLALNQVADSEQYKKATERADQGVATFLKLLVNFASIPAQQRVQTHTKERQQALASGSGLEDFVQLLDQALDTPEGRRVFYQALY